MKYCKTNHILIDNHGIHVLLFQASAVAHDIRKKKNARKWPDKIPALHFNLSVATL